jgi:hypothetical protein
LHRRDLLRLFATAASALPFVPESADAAIEIGRRLHIPGRFAAPCGMLDAEQARLIGGLAETILVSADTPFGPADIDLAGFIGRLLTEWYDYEEAQAFLLGLVRLDALARERYGAPLPELSEDRRTALLDAIESADGGPGSPEASWARLKALTLYGYLTSDRVLSAMPGEPIPGRFAECSSL